MMEIARDIIMTLAVPIMVYIAYRIGYDQGRIDEMSKPPKGMEPKTRD